MTGGARSCRDGYWPGEVICRVVCDTLTNAGYGGKAKYDPMLLRTAILNVVREEWR